MKKTRARKSHASAPLILSMLQMENAVGKICELQVKPLEVIMKEPLPAKLVKNSVSDPVLYLDRLSDVFRHVAPSNGCIGEASFILFSFS